MTTNLRCPLRKRESHLWSRDEHDWYVEPRWCSERLFSVEKFPGVVWDPSCGGGNIVASGEAAGLSIFGTDIVARRGLGEALVKDFMKDDRLFIDCIVSNPPFGIAEAYVKKALDQASHAVAMLLPSNWVQGDKRSRWLEATPLHRVYFITPRPSMPPGAVLAAGQAPGNGTTDYAWFVWRRNYGGPVELNWLRRDA